MTGVFFGRDCPRTVKVAEVRTVTLKGYSPLNAQHCTLANAARSLTERRFHLPCGVAISSRTPVSRDLATDNPAALVVVLGVLGAVVFGGLMVAIWGPVVW